MPLTLLLVVVLVALVADEVATRHRRLPGGPNA
jgi:hypothetical protein